MKRFLKKTLKKLQNLCKAQRLIIERIVYRPDKAQGDRLFVIFNWLAANAATLKIINTPFKLKQFFVYKRRAGRVLPILYMRF